MKIERNWKSEKQSHTKNISSDCSSSISTEYLGKEIISETMEGTGSKMRDQKYPPKRYKYHAELITNCLYLDMTT